MYLNKCDITPIVIKYVNNNYTKINESYDYISNNYFYVENYNKLCYSISHYKSAELKDIAVKLGIDIPIKHKKNDIYEDIKNKLKLIYLKI